MENANLCGKLSGIIFSDIIRKISLSGILCLGFILIIISFLEVLAFYQFIMGLGVSLVGGTLIGFYVGKKVGWPLGFWVGLIGGLLVVPPLALLVCDAVSAYYASFLSPIVGGLVGKWTELDDKRRLEENINKIKKDRFSSN